MVRMGRGVRVKGKEAGRCRRITHAHTRRGWGRRAAPSVSGRARLSVCVCVWVCDLCVCDGDRLGVGAGAGPGRGCGRCPRGGPRLRAGGCRRRRGLGGCQGGRVGFRVCGAAAGRRLRGRVLILLSPRCPCLLLPAESPCGSPRPPPCVSVRWGRSLGTRGSLSHLPRRRRRHRI